MMKKLELKQKAIRLRKKGYSYSEIQRIVPVSKASLSLWLSNIPLSLKQKERLIKLGNKGRLKANQNKRTQRLKNQKEILYKASIEVNGITKRELWLLGIMAYWCEGAKQKEYNISQPVVFSNTD